MSTHPPSCSRIYRWMARRGHDTGEFRAHALARMRSVRILFAVSCPPATKPNKTTGAVAKSNRQVAWHGMMACTSHTACACKLRFWNDQLACNHTIRAWALPLCPRAMSAHFHFISGVGITRVGDGDSVRIRTSVQVTADWTSSVDITFDPIVAVLYCCVVALRRCSSSPLCYCTAAALHHCAVAVLCHCTTVAHRSVVAYHCRMQQSGTRTSHLAGQQKRTVCIGHA